MMLPLYFLDSIASVPCGSRKDDVMRGLGALDAKMKQDVAQEARIRAIIAHPQGRLLLEAVFSHSPFLTRLILQYTDFFAEICARGADACFAELRASLEALKPASSADLMQILRIAKSKASLLIAIADIANLWSLEEVTAAMSQVAELCVQATLCFLLKQAAQKGEITLTFPGEPMRECGVFVLAMGKLGARELNYSSDIDLIVFFDKERIQYSGAHTLQQCLSKLTQEMVRLLQERTAHGYVFRVDLRLRPDPASTPLAMSVAGALTYYETVGQNWERAAFIKARPIAGDIEAGYQFLEQIRPFIWRKHLDFAAIADIQSIKRQMDAHTGAHIALPGHNIKTGIGGIREIEFFAQIHQLIWGGRVMALRTGATCKTLEALAKAGLIDGELSEKLIEIYHFLRRVEHRLQMIDDAQTHTIPAPEEARVALAAFMEFSDVQSFEQTLLEQLQYVHDNFSQSFQGTGSLGSEGGKLSFTGVENDPQTLETIAKMGYRNPASVSEIIQGWHRGTRRATRTKRARELITELTPALLKAFAATAEPDQAFMHFDEFLKGLPAGVQLFSLFNVNPHLLDLIGVIMGSAPAIAESLSKNPHLLEIVLTSGFSHELPDENLLFNELASALLLARHFEDEMDIVRRFKNERQFQAGVQLLRGQVNCAEANAYLSDIAENSLKALLHRVEMNFSEKHPELETGNLAIIAMGRLGARELTFGSDIDLVFVYDDSAQNTAGLYTKLSQRFIGAITALTPEGRLYDIDTRLRPSGMDGALAISVSAFDKYFSESAWTFEFMALTRARVITGNPALKERLKDVLEKQLIRPRASEVLVQDIWVLRKKVTREFGNDDPWNLKYAHGGIMDLYFLVQYFLLLHAHAIPALLTPFNESALSMLIQHKLIDPADGQALIAANHFLNTLLTLLRLCGGSAFKEETAPEGLKSRVAATLQLPNFDSVKAALLATLVTVKSQFDAVFCEHFT